MAVVLRRSRTDPLTSGEAFAANCNSTDQVGNLVGVNGPANPTYQVGSVDPTNPSTMPAIGIIISKPSDTTCVVQRFGTVNLGSPGLITGRLCFVGLNSRPTITPPIPTSSPIILQIVGVAVNGSTFEIMPNPNIVKVRP